MPILADVISSKHFEQLLIWSGFLIVVWATTRMRQRRREYKFGEFHCESIQISLLILNLAVMVILLVAWVFLFQFKIESPLWLFWPPAYEVSRILLHGPLLAGIVVATVWAIIGRTYASYRVKTMLLAAISMIEFSVNCWIESTMAQN